MTNQELRKKKDQERSWWVAFKNALNGCFYAFSTQRNFVIHFLLSFLVILVGFWLKLSLEKFLFLILAIVFGLAAEMINTSFEAVVDLVTEERKVKAKIAKDVAAGMVLLISFGLAVVGLLILFPPLWQKLFGGG